MALNVIRSLATLAGAGLLAGAGVGLYARYIEPKRLDISELDLSAGDDPLTIAFVSDIHIGPHFSAEDLEPTVQALEAIRPDVILYGGDFICESPRFLHDLELPLKRIAATARIGNWGVWGNHDLANLRSRVEPVLERCGVTMLTNESAHIRNDLWVAGVDDVLLGKADLGQTYAEVPDDARVIALWHEPDVADQMVPYNPLLMLSGHTHGGQVRLPLVGELATPKLGKKFVAGHFNINGMLLYVSRGIGMYRPPVRLHCRPELLILKVD